MVLEIWARSKLAWTTSFLLEKVKWRQMWRNLVLSIGPWLHVWFMYVHSESCNTWILLNANALQGHFPWVKCGQWPIHCNRKGVGRWWPWKYVLGLPSCMYWCLGQSSEPNGDDYCLPNVGKLYRLCRSLGWPCIGVWSWCGWMVRWVKSCSTLLKKMSTYLKV